MSFFELQSTDVISTVYTVYPTRSLVLVATGSGDGGSYSKDSFETKVNVYDSGSMPGVGFRNYFDIRGNLFSQSFYAGCTPKLMFSHVLTASEKNAIHRLRNIYLSSAFHKPENFSSSSIVSADSEVCHVITIPNILIGSKIKPGSLSLVSGNKNAFDDGYGGLYLSGGGLIGSVFYEYGLVYLGHEVGYATLIDGTTITAHFSATNHVPMNVYICEAPRSALNFSTNPSYTELSGTKYEITTSDPKTFITTVGLYDKDYELVGVAKVATPLLNQETDGIQFRLKLNF